MDTLEDLGHVRDIVEYVWALLLDNPAEAVEVATARLAQSGEIDRSDCARVEFLVVRAAARRQGGDLDGCAHDLDSAETVCTCSDCRPRILRQRALLATVQEQHDSARELIERALFSCVLTDLGYLPALHSSRFVVLYYGGDHHHEALKSAQLAEGALSAKDGLPWAVAVFRLTAAYMALGRWSEAWQTLEDAESNLDSVNGVGARYVKRYIRWARALVGLQVGKISRASARNRIRYVFQEFQERDGLGVADIAAALADSALLGMDVTQGALSLLAVLPDGTPEALRAKVDTLAKLEPGDDVRGPALELRELFPSAPPLPPSLKDEK